MQKDLPNCLVTTLNEDTRHAITLLLLGLVIVLLLLQRFVVVGVTVACLDAPIGLPFVQNDRHSAMIPHDPCHLLGT